MNGGIRGRLPRAADLFTPKKKIMKAFDEYLCKARFPDGSEVTNRVMLDRAQAEKAARALKAKSVAKNGAVHVEFYSLTQTVTSKDFV